MKGSAEPGGLDQDDGSDIEGDVEREEEQAPTRPKDREQREDPNSTDCLDTDDLPLRTMAGELP